MEAKKVMLFDNQELRSRPDSGSAAATAAPCGRGGYRRRKEG
ncbi:MAG: hypothetical protein ABIK47_00785 [candidate division WOR-3 bacterium]